VLPARCTRRMRPSTVNGISRSGPACLTVHLDENARVLTGHHRRDRRVTGVLVIPGEGDPAFPRVLRHDRSPRRRTSGLQALRPAGRRSRGRCCLGGPVFRSSRASGRLPPGPRPWPSHPAGTQAPRIR
jgi:hypothetical protein